jgi:hypothetical protein
MREPASPTLQRTLLSTPSLCWWGSWSHSGGQAQRYRAVGTDLDRLGGTSLRVLVNREGWAERYAATVDAP